MQVTWKPEDGEPDKVWQFDPYDVGRKDAMAIEKQYGSSWDRWVHGLRLGEIHARAVLLWHMMKQVHPRLQFNDIPDFRVRQLDVQMGVAELKELYERAKKIRLDPEERERFEAQFEVDMRDALEREGKDPDSVTVIEGHLELEEGPELPKQQ